MSYINPEFSAVLLIYMSLAFNTMNFIQWKQPSPLIDEIFHIPQGMEYCRGNFSYWDPKITTLPGLYIVSYGILKMASSIGSFPMCSIYNLRVINAACSCLNLFLIFSILTYNSPKKNSRYQRMALWSSFNLAIFPVSFFFNFFYYTDTMSTFFFLLMGRMHLSKNYWISASIGCCSVMVRQTNIVWVGYLLLDLFIASPELSKRSRTIAKHLYNCNFKMITQQVWRDLGTLGSQNSPFRVFHDASAYVFTCLMFVSFVYVNGGIVVGDKSAHTPVMHGTQIFYFSLFCLGFGFPHFFEMIPKFLKIIRNKKFTYIFLLALGLGIVHVNTLVHPYLLADNRHYIFYIWKRVFEKYYIVRYFLVPFYLFGLYSIDECLRKPARIGYWLCCILVLVPQKLLELRYFILPFIMLRLQMRCKTWWHLALETAFYLSVNAVTLYIFSSKEFYWADLKGPQRIIW